MLSCRYSGPGTRHYNRRLTSADRILQLILEEGSDSLPPLPLIPYAMSLSTTMVYRAFRDGQREPQASYKDLDRCSTALEILSQRWTSAKGIAKLARRLLKVIERAPRRKRFGNPNSVPLPLTAGCLDSNSNLIAAVRNAESALEPPLVGHGTTFDGDLAFYPVDPDVSHTQLDLAFSELFDVGMPNVFRDLTTWGEKISTTNDEASSTTGSDFLLSAYFN